MLRPLKLQLALPPARMRPRFGPRVVIEPGVIHRLEYEKGAIKPFLNDWSMKRPIHVHASYDAAVVQHSSCGACAAEGVAKHRDAADIETTINTGEDVPSCLGAA